MDIKRRDKRFPSPQKKWDVYPITFIPADFIF